MIFQSYGIVHGSGESSIFLDDSPIQNLEIYGGFIDVPSISQL